MPFLPNDPCNMALSKTKVIKVKIGVLSLLLSQKNSAITDFRQHLEKNCCTPEGDTLLYIFFMWWSIGSTC